MLLDRSERTRFALLAIFPFVVLSFSSGVATAGPPLICVPIDTAEESVIAENGREAIVVDEALRVLSDDVPILARMETHRRAAMRLQGNATEARALLARLMARALDAESVGKPSAAAWFDAGYFAQCCEQVGALGRDFAGVGTGTTSGAGNRGGVTGYAWVERAIKLDGDRHPSMQLAAAMMTAMRRDDRFAHHLRRAFEHESNEALFQLNADRIRDRVTKIRGYLER